MLSSDQWIRRAVFLEELNKLRIREDVDNKEHIIEYIERSVEELNENID
jgi:hypothetical protein